MLIEEITQESFDSSFPYKWLFKKSNGWAGSFKTNQDIIELDIRPFGENGYNIEFISHDSGHLATNTNDQPNKVFSTIIKLIGEFIEEMEPEMLSFSADKTKSISRAKLYDRLIKRFGASFGYETDIIKNSDKNTYILKRTPHQ